LRQAGGGANRRYRPEAAPGRTDRSVAERRRLDRTGDARRGMEGAGLRAWGWGALDLQTGRSLIPGAFWPRCAAAAVSGPRRSSFQRSDPATTHSGRWGLAQAEAFSAIRDIAAPLPHRAGHSILGPGFRRRRS